MTDRLSVIIPVLNEAPRIGPLIEALRLQRGITLEIIVADGGSRDDSAAIARRAGATVITSAPGRASQMNAGATLATNDLLLFLHADSEFADEKSLTTALAHWRAETSELGSVRLVGHFRLRFDHASPAFRFLEEKSALNRPYTTNGDQAMLFHRDFFEEVGRFDETLPFLEDQKIIREVRRRGGTVTTLPGELTTATRRFEREGFAARYASMALIMAAFATDRDEFLADAPHLYDVQSRAGRLDLLGHLRAAGRALERGDDEPVTLMRDLGQLVCHNAWQLALLADVARGDEELAVLRLFDRHADRLVRSRLAHTVAGAATVATVLGGLRTALEVQKALRRAALMARGEDRHASADARDASGGWSFRRTATPSE